MATKKVGTGRHLTEVTSPAAFPASNPGPGPVTAHNDGVPAATDHIQSIVKEVREMDNITKTTEEMTSFSQGNVEAILRSGQAWAAGLQAITQTIAETAQAQLDHTLSTWKALTSAKSLKEAMDLQTRLARTSLETALAEAGKLTEVSIKLTEQAIAPLAARMTLAVEKLTSQRD